MTRTPHANARLGAVGAGALLGLVVLAVPAAPAHAQVFVNCASTHTVGTLVIGNGCAGQSPQFQSGYISDSTHTYGCADVSEIPLPGTVEGTGCTLLG